MKSSSAFFLVLGLVLGLTETSRAVEVPPLTGRIVDEAHLLPPDVAASLSEELAAHERRTGNQVAVLTLPTLQGEPLEGYSHRVATTWKLGQKGTDNGVLLLVVPGDRRVRIEVGYGLEGLLTDAKSSRIIRDEMVPRFRSGDYAQGIAAGVHAIIGTIEGSYTPPENVPRSAGRSGDETWGVIPVAIFVGAVVGGLLSMAHGVGVLGGGLLSFLLALSAGLLLALLAAAGAVIGAIVLAALFRGARYLPSGGFDGGWSGGGGFGGGFSGSDSFSGGGGDFGGGGASGRW